MLGKLFLEDCSERAVSLPRRLLVRGRVNAASQKLAGFLTALMRKRRAVPSVLIPLGGGLTRTRQVWGRSRASDRGTSGYCPNASSISLLSNVYLKRYSSVLDVETCTYRPRSS